MARSKASRRRGRANRDMSIPYARQRPNIENFVIGGSATDNTGAVIGGASPTGPATWFNNTTGIGFGLNSGVPVSFQAVVIVAAPNTSTPTIGRMKVDSIVGSVFIYSPSAAVRMTVAVGIYISEFNSSSSKWDVRDPLTTADAARDDYYFLEMQAAGMPVSGNETAPSMLRFDLRLANPLIIGGGQAVHVTVSQVNDGANTVRLTSAFRTRVGPVA